MDIVEVVSDPHDSQQRPGDPMTPSILSVALATFPMGTRVRKKTGSSWQGRVVGYYSSSLTTLGLCVESEREPGSVQIYPLKALEVLPESTNADLSN